MRPAQRISGSVALLLAGCAASPPINGADAALAPDAATSALDCDTLETLAPGYELAPIATSFSDGPPPHGSRATPRLITARQVYRRTAVAQYGGVADVEPPRPTLIAFEFDAASNQLTGNYCVVQATDDGAGGVEHGHYAITFVPRTPGSRSDYDVTATLGANTFPIGFDGTADALTIYADTGATAYLESYEIVPGM